MLNFNLNEILQSCGVYSEWWISICTTMIHIVMMGIISWLVYWITKKWLADVVVRLIGKTATQWDDLMFQPRFFTCFAWLVTPVIIQMGVTYLEWEISAFFYKLLNVWIIVACVVQVSIFLDGINRIYESYPVSKNRPIKVFIQIIKIFISCLAVILVISIILNKDPEALVVGLGAFAAVLMLIFKDTILGFVAGVQLMSNKMVKLGDWIVMPSANADGEVLEINLITVKVQNWDKTISTIPTYKLVSESFTNWRGMEESNGRRIKRSVSIDVQSIHYLTQEELEELKKSMLLKDYITRKMEELAKHNKNKENPLDERRLTNIGTFREYMESWIASNPNIAQDMTHMVRQLQPGPTGVPMEIYCFSRLQKWVDYERVQADIFDHFYAVISLFNLRIFQYPSDLLSKNK